MLGPTPSDKRQFGRIEMVWCLRPDETAAQRLAHQRL